MLLVVSSREDIEDTLTWDFYYLTLPKWWCANAHTTSLDDPLGSAREIGKLSELKDCKVSECVTKTKRKNNKKINICTLMDQSTSTICNILQRIRYFAMDALKDCPYIRRRSNPPA
ncbi:Protein of unknown function [Cotesia congregata]|uniref:Uncharacterized protein n=1 Tax=Cotesia congregata TaxID=51543 RepID=A0A8J2MSA7_COTCN|nr:Protein of unknown function [Cotesia congregata]